MASFVGAASVVEYWNRFDLLGTETQKTSPIELVADCNFGFAQESEVIENIPEDQRSRKQNDLRTIRHPLHLQPG